jgi:hypothetical protein
MKPDASPSLGCSSGPWTPRKPRRESGQAVILVVVVFSVVMIGALGFALDGSHLYAQRQMAQTAADAAAQAGILSIYKGTNSTSAHPFTSNGTFTCTVPPASLDLRTPCVYAQLNGFGTAADTVTVTVNPAISIAGSGIVSAIFVTVQRTVNTTLMRYLGTTSTLVKAKSTAGLVNSVPSTCIYVLDPSAGSAFAASNGATITADCGMAVNSNSASAVTITGSASVNLPIAVTGGYQINNGGSATPMPVSGVTPVSDPFGTVAGPAAGACNFTNYHPPWGTWSPTPGTYCGGITIDNGATANFAAGTYIINGGGLHFAGGTTITGSGVMFYLTGTNATYGSAVIDNGTNVTLSAQASGTYTGILFYQDRSINSAVNASFAGGATMKLTGSLYFPTTGIAYSNGTAVVNYSTALIAKQVSMTGGAGFKLDPTGSKTGLLTKTAALAE